MRPPEDLGNQVITLQEFRELCIRFQKCISMEIARHLHLDQQESGEERGQLKTTHGIKSGNPDSDSGEPDLSAEELMREEELLANMFSANDELIEALKMYDNLQRLAEEYDGRLRPQRIRDNDLDPAHETESGGRWACYVSSFSGST
ncbi:hypothetical protein DFH09DRAFT_1188115 [Mycena vulgaris]|nr:hypothetical protein DFH09DRAFT_1188115 [Mycena vulgaris]